MYLYLEKSDIDAKWRLVKGNRGIISHFLVKMTECSDFPSLCTEAQQRSDGSEQARYWTDDY